MGKKQEGPQSANSGDGSPTKRDSKDKDVKEPVNMPSSPLRGPTVAPKDDSRVAQQLRVHEIIGAGKSAEKSDKKYSPRTEGYIKQVGDVLDFYGMSRSDIAALVKRCNHDETQ